MIAGWNLTIRRRLRIMSGVTVVAFALVTLLGLYSVSRLVMSVRLLLSLIGLLVALLSVSDNARTDRYTVEEAEQAYIATRSSYDTLMELAAAHLGYSKGEASQKMTEEFYADLQNLLTPIEAVEKARMSFIENRDSLLLIVDHLVRESNSGVTELLPAVSACASIMPRIAFATSSEMAPYMASLDSSTRAAQRRGAMRLARELSGLATMIRGTLDTRDAMWEESRTKTSNAAIAAPYMDRIAPSAQLADRLQRFLYALFSSFCVIITLLILFFMGRLVRQIGRPLRLMGLELERVAQGDLRQGEILPTIAARHDEIGRIAQAESTMLEGLR